MRDGLIRVGDQEGAEAVLSLIAASVVADELGAALIREDDEAVYFHAGLLTRLLDDVREPDIRIAATD
jgi:hypothetical protein